MIQFIKDKINEFVDNHSTVEVEEIHTYFSAIIITKNDGESSVMWAGPLFDKNFKLIHSANYVANEYVRNADMYIWHDGSIVDKGDIDDVKIENVQIDLPLIRKWLFNFNFGWHANLNQLNKLLRNAKPNCSSLLLTLPESEE